MNLTIFDNYYVDIMKFVLALMLGAVIGLERELRSKSAGFRTMIFISVGSCFFTDIAVHIGNTSDGSRIVANIITGIGFLGAGAIFRDTVGVSGMTTAAMIWIVAAVGMAVGLGEYGVAFIVTLLTQLVQWGFARFENIVDTLHQSRSYTLTYHQGSCTQEYIEEIFRDHKLRSKLHSYTILDGESIVTWEVRGAKKHHQAVQERLLIEPRIRGVKG